MKTLALVLGNNDYYGNAKLDNAVADATAIAEVFGRLGFEVILRVDCKAEDYAELLEEYENRITDFDASIFYFAGHGFENNGENYLAAIDCQLSNTNKYHFGQTCIRLSEILAIFEKNPNKINIAIIDACRKSFERSGTIAFSPFQAPRGTLIAFSTSPNEGASDVGFEGHSIYTGALLRYIGRERISIEELFKKVRKTVYNISEGKYTSWEHTSLINDYYFNTGQLVHSLSIPYDEKVVKDINYNATDEFGELIQSIKSYNWDVQNPAINKILRFSVNELDKNQQFILGRNLLQASGAAFSAENFMENLGIEIKKFTKSSENHVLNGILFEVYFNSLGEFRREKTKKHFIENILQLRKDLSLKSSFEFIANQLESTQYPLTYIPKPSDDIIDVDVNASPEKVNDFLGNEVIYEVISGITINDVEVLSELPRHEINGLNALGLKNIIAKFMTAPEDLINVNSNIELKNIGIAKPIKEEKDLFGW